LRIMFGPVIDTPGVLVLVRLFQTCVFICAIVCTIQKERYVVYLQELQRNTDEEEPPVGDVTPATKDEACCRVCLTNINTHALIPCGHLILCAHCAVLYGTRKNKHCPLCDAMVTNVYKIYN